MKKFLSLTFLLCFCCFALWAQDLSGFWKGTLNMPGGCFPVNFLELQLNIHGDSVLGNSYHYQDVDNYIKKDFSGSYNAGAKSLLLREGIVNTYNIPQHCVICIKNYRLAYSREGNKEILSGEWDGKIMGTSVPCGPSSLVLYRIKESAFKETKEIMVNTNELRLDMYDNGQIDGDTISVMVNKKIILSHQGLSAHPITVYVKIDPDNPVQEVEMIAENLGSIPPNTALMIVTAGEKRYQLFLSSTETKSAKVRFIYNKDSVSKNTETEEP